VATSACWAESDRARRADVVGAEVFIRGTKRKDRLRTVPIVTPEQRSLLAHALEYGGGAGDVLFAPWPNVRHDLEAACRRAGIDRCSPNDLRRTCSTWLRAAGAAPDLIAPVMGHADTRMVERVYGRLAPADLALRLAVATGRGAEVMVMQLVLRDLEALFALSECCIAGASDSGDLARPAGLLGSKNAAFAGDSVPRDGIEPPTRGFSISYSRRASRNDSARVADRSRANVNAVYTGQAPGLRVVG